MADRRRDSGAVYGGIRVGRVLGIPVYVSLSTLVLVLFIALTYSTTFGQQVPALSTGEAYAAAVVLAVFLFLSVFLHELGHAIVALRVGTRVRSITLMMLGGVTAMEREPADPARAYLVSVAGPMVSLLLAGIGLLITPDWDPRNQDTVTEVISFQLAFTNGIVAIFNLLPGLPLDGGQLLRAGAWRLTGDPNRATRIAAWAGRGVAGVVILLAILESRRAPEASLTSLVFGIFLGLFIWQGASQALQMAAVRTRLPRLIAGAMARPAIGVPPDMPLAEALRRLQAAGARGIVVVTGTGIPEAVVVEQAVSATPEQRRPWVNVSAVARSVRDGLTIPADLGGEDLVEAMQANPASEYVVVDRRGGLVGVLSVRDVAAVLDPAAAG